MQRMDRMLSTLTLFQGKIEIQLIDIYFKHFVFDFLRIGELVALANLNAISSIRFLYSLTSIGKEETETLKVLHDFTRNVVKDRRKMLAKGEGNDKWLLLDHYLQSEVDGRFYDDDEIRGELDSTILGGHDTTKAALAFTLYAIAKYPEVQQKVFEEACLVFKDDPERDVVDGDVAKLEYTDTVVKETMRMFPPVPYVARKLTDEFTVNGYTFPKDAEVLISPYLMGRNPRYFKDPLVYNPDRFIGLDSYPEGFIPFSVGMRKCIGQTISIMLLKIMVAKITRKFVVSQTPGHENVVLFSDIVLNAKGGIILTFEDRIS